METWIVVVIQGVGQHAILVRKVMKYRDRGKLIHTIRASTRKSELKKCGPQPKIWTTHKARL